MVKVLFICLFILDFVMGVLTFLVLDKELRELVFSGGSVGSTMEFFGPKFGVVFMLFLASNVCIIIFRKRVKLLLFSYVICSFLWMLCGRTIGIYWSGEVITGWFYIQTDRFLLYKEGSTFKSEAINYTNVQISNVFYIILENNQVNYSLYVGPVIGQEIKSYFDDSHFTN